MLFAYRRVLPAPFDIANLLIALSAYATPLNKIIYPRPRAACSRAASSSSLSPRLRASLASSQIFLIICPSGSYRFLISSPYDRQYLIRSLWAVFLNCKSNYLPRHPMLIYVVLFVIFRIIADAGMLAIILCDGSYMTWTYTISATTRNAPIINIAGWIMPIGSLPWPGYRGNRGICADSTGLRCCPHRYPSSRISRLRIKISGAVVIKAKSGSNCWPSIGRVGIGAGGIHQVPKASYI